MYRCRRHVHVAGVVGDAVVGGGVVGGCVVGGVVVGGCVVGGFVVGGFVVGGCVGGCVGGGCVVGDFDAVGFPVVAPTITPGPTPPNVLTGCETPVDGLFAWVADDVGVWVVTMVLFPLFPGVLPLLEISTAMIATMPMAAAPIPANKKVRDPVPRGDGIRWASFW
jgi:hypothetical protein